MEIEIINRLRPVNFSSVDVGDFFKNGKDVFIKLSNEKERNSFDIKECHFAKFDANDSVQKAKKTTVEF